MGSMQCTVEFGYQLINFAVLMNLYNLELFQFIVGRGRSSSFIISNLMISKTHCVFQKKDGVWTVRDKVRCNLFYKNAHVNRIKAK
jgi:hypothetical protein